MLNLERVSFLDMDWDIIISLITLCAVILLRLFIPSYLSKKAENLATKEDIESITHKVESAKLHYMIELEKIKSDMNVLVQRENALINKREEILTSFYDKVIELEHFPLISDMGNLRFDHPKRLLFWEENHEKFNLIMHDMLSCFYRVMLYFQKENSLIECSGKIINSSVDLSKHLESYFYNIQQAMMIETEAYRNRDATLFKQESEKTFSLIKEYMESRTKFEDDLKNAIQNFMRITGEYLTQRNVYHERND